jgi:hypothetical protein
MRTRILLSLIAVSWLIPVAAGASDTPAQAVNPLASARHLSCTFTFYTTTRWANGVPEVRTGDDEFKFDIDTIDARNHTARIVATTASANVSAFLTDTGLNVIEQTPLGNFIVTTVFTTGRIGDALPAVHSRHLGDVSVPPSPSQYFGTCQVVPQAGAASGGVR